MLLVGHCILFHAHVTVQIDQKLIEHATCVQFVTSSNTSIDILTQSDNIPRNCERKRERVTHTGDRTERERERE